MVRWIGPFLTSKPPPSLHLEPAQIPDPRSQIPDPKEEDPEIPPSAGKAKRAGRLAADWVPDRTEVNQRAESEAKARGVDLRAELVKLRDWATSTAAKRADWNATWRNWTRNARSESRRPTHANALELQLERVAMLEREEQLERAAQEHEPS